MMNGRCKDCSGWAAFRDGTHRGLCQRQPATSGRFLTYHAMESCALFDRRERSLKQGQPEPKQKRPA